MKMSEKEIKEEIKFREQVIAKAEQEIKTLQQMVNTNNKRITKLVESLKHGIREV